MNSIGLANLNVLNISITIQAERLIQISQLKKRCLLVFSISALVVWYNSVPKCAVISDILISWQCCYTVNVNMIINSGWDRRLGFAQVIFGWVENKQQQIKIVVSLHLKYCIVFVGICPIKQRGSCIFNICLSDVFFTVIMLI